MFSQKVSDSSDWKKLISTYRLTENQKHTILRYIDYLHEDSSKYNLTALHTIHDIIWYHIADSLEVLNHIDLSSYQNIADVGTGAGIPGLILAIMLPEKNIYLIEVLNKRISFLEKVIKELNLTNCTVINKDFKSLIRKGGYGIDLFCARASLPLRELVYVYSGASQYQNSSITYWASKDWDQTKEFSQQKIQKLIKNTSIHIFPYITSNKCRKYIYIKKL